MFNFNDLLLTCQNFVNVFVPLIIKALIIFAVGFILNGVLIKLIGKGLEKSKLDKTVYNFIKSAIKIVLYVVVLVMILSIFGIPMTSIIAVIGSAGLAVGLAMQSSLSNIACGISILINKQFKSGDYIAIDGTEGTVQDITIFATKMLTVDNKSVYIPNGKVATAVVINYTEEINRRVDWSFDVSAENDASKVVTIVKDILKKNSLIIEVPESFVSISGFGFSSFKIEVRGWTKSENYWDVYFMMFEDIKTEFDKNGIVFAKNEISVKN